MDRKLKIWEMALLFGVLCAIMGGMWLDREQTQLANQVIRLHVIANSDSDGDQALKLKVRDGVLAQAEQLYPEGASLEQAAQALERNLAVLAAAGQAVVEQEGAGYPVRAELTRCWFPTKEYDDFALPAGEYTALRVTIGEGAGRNWWCVAYGRGHPDRGAGGIDRPAGHGGGDAHHRGGRGLRAEIQGHRASGGVARAVSELKHHANHRRHPDKGDGMQLFQRL